MNEKQTRADLGDDLIEVGEVVWAENQDGCLIIKREQQYLTEIREQRNIRDLKYNQ